MRAIADPTLCGSGKITGVFPCPDSMILAVASDFVSLNNPPARASYGGQTLHHRVALYRQGERKPFVWFDRLRHPVNDVAFHAVDPVIAIGTGRYDGGCFFEGDLIVWNWKTSNSWRPFNQIPEVVRCRFDRTGDKIEALVRPWDDGTLGPQGRPENDAFKSFFLVHASYSGLLHGERSKNIQLDPRGQLSADRITDTGFDNDLSNQEALEDRLARLMNLPSVSSRGAIWDVAWLDAERLALVHDDCHLQIFSSTGDLLHEFTGVGHGSEILKSEPPCVNVVEFIKSSVQPLHGHWLSKLLALENDTLTEIGAFAGSYTFSSSCGRCLLGRLDRALRPADARGDVLLDIERRTVMWIELGQYDCFNHYIGIDGAPYLFMLQGTPPSSHEKKRLCIVSPDGDVRSLWPLIDGGVAPEPHALEVCGCYMEDALGEGVIIAAIISGPAEPVVGFLYRKRIDRDGAIWRRATGASASSIAFISACDFVAAAFLDGTFQILDAASGDVKLQGKVRINGLPTVVISLDSMDRMLAMGMIDGRVIVSSMEELLGLEPVEGWIDLLPPS